MEAFCSRCNVLKPVDEFPVDRSKASGRRSQCKACDAARCRDYYARNREAKIARVTERRRAAAARRNAPVTTRQATPDELATYKQRAARRLPTRGERAA